MASALDRKQKIKDQLGKFVENGPFVLIYVNPDFTYEYVNSTYLDYLPNEVDDVIGKSIADVAGEQAFEMVRHHLEKAFAGETCQFEAHFDLPQGRIYFDETYIPDKDEDGNVRGVFAFLIDSTEKKFVESALEESYQRQLLTVKSLDVGVWDWTDINSDQVYWSTRVYEILGYHNLEVEPSVSQFMSWMHPEDLKKNLGDSDIKDYLGAMNREEEFRIKNKNGEYIWVRSNMIGVPNEKGEVVRLIGALRDINDEVITRERLNLFHNIVASSKDLIVVYNEDGYVLESNDAFDSFFSIEENKEKGHLKEVHSVDFIKLFYTEVVPHVEKGTSWRGEVKIHNSQGDEIIVDNLMNPHFTKDGQLLYISATMRDLSEQKKMTEALEQQRAQAFQNSRLASLGEMAGGIAHEINNPLAILMGAVHNMEKLVDKGQVEPDRLKHFVKMSQKTVQRISRIVSGLLKFANKGDGQDEVVDLPLEVLVSSVLDLCYEKFQSHGVDVNKDLFDGQLIVKVNRVQFEQVLLNLLNNSFDAIQSGSPKWIRLVTEPKGRTVVLRVRDSGSGIPEDIQGRIMEPFFSTKDVGKGTGLGLSISKSIMQAMQGDLNYNPNCANTEFVLELKSKASHSEAA